MKEANQRYRYEKAFWFLAALFLSAMTLLNVVGITKFINVFGLSVAVGVLPYPLTFLCTDLISEIYGKKRAQHLVALGFFINLFVLFILWLGQVLPAVDSSMQPPWQEITLGEAVLLPNGSKLEGKAPLFSFIYFCTSGAVAASMLAYLCAQFIDVQIFHFVKKKSKGRHLWLRNNVSTLISQFVDSLAVVGVTFGAVFLDGGIALSTLFYLFLSNYIFKALSALLDTPFFYFGTWFLKRYIGEEALEKGF